MINRLVKIIICFKSYLPELIKSNIRQINYKTTLKLIKLVLLRF